LRLTDERQYSTAMFCSAVLLFCLFAASYRTQQKSGAIGSAVYFGDVLSRRIGDVLFYTIFFSRRGILFHSFTAFFSAKTLLNANSKFFCLLLALYFFFAYYFF